MLITWGVRNHFAQPSNAERVHALLADSELTIFDDAGHFSYENADDDWAHSEHGGTQKSRV